MELNPTLVKYDDGTEFTVAHLIVSGLAGAALGTVGAYAKWKYDDWRNRRTMKKYGWPEEFWKK